MCHGDVPPGTRSPNVRTEDVAIDVGGDEAMPSLLAIPRATPAPAVLVINGRNGRTPFSDHLTMRLAEAGYLAADPEFFFRLGPVSAYVAEPERPAGAARAANLDVERWPMDLDHAADWLRRHPSSNGQLGTIGFCMGGSAVFLMAARRGDVSASVSYYGFVRAPRGPSPIDKVGQMRGPILGHWGAADPAISLDDVATFGKALDGAAVEREFHVYEGLGHNFLDPLLLDGAAPGHDGACTSWARTLDFLRRRFAQEPVDPPRGMEGSASA